MARPPGPDGLPLIGNTIRHVREQGAFYEAVAAEYGGVASVGVVGVGDFVLVSDPDLVERVLVSESEQYRKHEISRDLLGELLGDGLLLSEGERWRRQRDLVQPAFSPERLESYVDVMRSNAELTVDRWQAGGTYDLLDEMQELTLRVIVESMFGSQLDYDRWNIRETVDALQEPGKPLKQPVGFAVPKWVPIPMWRRYHRAVAQFDRLVEEMIRRRRQDAGQGEDLLSMLLRARDEGGDRMSDELIRDELMTILFAGHETTAVALTFALYELARRPAVQAELAAELDATFDGRSPPLSTLAALDYTERVVKEALRLYPPVPAIPRQAVTDVTLGGYPIPEGSLVVASPWAVHRSPEHYDDPLEFRPDRWADGLAASLPNFAFFPFGGGSRRCLGRHFAMVESRLVLATLVDAYDVDLVSEPSLELSVTITTRPVSDIEVRVTDR